MLLWDNSADPQDQYGDIEKQLVWRARDLAKLMCRCCVLSHDAQVSGPDNIQSAEEGLSPFSASDTVVTARTTPTKPGVDVAIERAKRQAVARKVARKRSSVR